MAELRLLDHLAQATGRGVRVLVVDSGVESGHAVFGDRPPRTVGLNVDPGGGFTVGDEAPLDLYGHGTAVAGILRDVAPEAELTSLRVLGTDLRAHSARVIHALRWGIQEGFDLINCSFGSSAVQHLGDYKRVVDEAYCANVWLVAAVNGTGLVQEYPGGFTGVLATRAGTFDAPTGLRHHRGELVEFESRGLDLDVPWKGGGTRNVSGSSLAAPHLAGLAARLRELRPDFNAIEAKAALYRWCARQS